MSVIGRYAVGLRVLTLPLLTIAAVLGWRMLADASAAPIERVVVLGELKHLPRAQIEARLSRWLDAGFYEVDIAEMRDSIEAMPWVRHASIARQWPGTLQIRVQERRPIARWGDDQMISDQGVRFAHQDFYTGRALTQLYADDQYLGDVVTQYMAIERQFQRYGLGVESVRRMPGGGWKIQATQGIRLWLSRADVGQQLKRLDQLVEAQLSDRFLEINQIDMRHPNSVAVQWNDVKQKIAAE